MKVLVVDDVRVIADTLAAILRTSGFEAAAAYSGAAAVETANSFRPDLIVSDVVMPDMDGIDAALHVKRIMPECKFLFFSGQAQNADILRKAERIFGPEVRVLAKPVHPHELLAEVAEQKYINRVA